MLVQEGKAKVNIKVMFDPIFTSIIFPQVTLQYWQSQAVQLLLLCATALPQRCLGYATSLPRAKLCCCSQHCAATTELIRGGGHLQAASSETVLPVRGVSPCAFAVALAMCRCSGSAMPMLCGCWRAADRVSRQQQSCNHARAVSVAV